MKRLMSLILAFVLTATLGTGLCYAEEEHVSDPETWEDVAKLDAFYGFAITNSGNVLLTEKTAEILYQGIENWKNIADICVDSWGIEKCYGITKSGDVLVTPLYVYDDAAKKMVPDGSGKYAEEDPDNDMFLNIASWNDVKEFYYDEYGGVYLAICSDGSVKWAAWSWCEDTQTYEKLAKEKVVDFSCASDLDHYLSNGWAAVTEKGKVITTRQDYGTETWKDMEKVWLLDGAVIGRKKDGSTVVGCSKSMSKEDKAYVKEQFSGCRNIKDIVEVWDSYAVLLDNGTVELHYTEPPFFDSEEVISYLDGLKGVSKIVMVNNWQPICLENGTVFMEEDYEFPLAITSRGQIIDVPYHGKYLHAELSNGETEVRDVVQWSLSDDSVLAVTTEGHVARVTITVQDTPAEILPEEAPQGTPSAADLEEILTREKKLIAPKEADYLAEYRVGTVVLTEGEEKVIGFFSASDKKNGQRVPVGERVTVLAEKNDRYCVILQSTQLAYWVRKDHIALDS